MISCRDWWPWTKPDYITTTWRQSNNQWSGGIAAYTAPKNSECKNLLEKFSPRHFGIRTESSSLIIFQRAKLSTRSITHLFWCNWRIFWRKNAAGSSPRGGGVLFLHDKAPAHRALATQKKLAYLRFKFLDHPPYSQDYHLFPGLKNKWKVAIFRPTRRSLLPRRPGWTDKLLNFFKWLAELEQRAKKCIELRMV